MGSGVVGVVVFVQLSGMIGGARRDIRVEGRP